MSDATKTRIELQVRIPRDVRDWMRDRAQNNLRSMNSEFIQIIRAEMVRDGRMAEG